MTVRSPLAGSTTRCASCARALGFEDWSAGKGKCSRCLQRGAVAPPGGRVHTRAPSPARAAPNLSGYRAYQRMVDEVPDELMAELSRALEEEASHRQPGLPDPNESLLKGIVEELRLGGSRGELQYAFLGFAGGFSLNVALMKYVQMSSGATLDAVFAPMFLGGLLTGTTCAVIGWGLAKLRER